MDTTTESSPIKPTDELLRLIREEFRKLLVATMQEKNNSSYPFIHIGPNGKPEEQMVSFLYQGGLAHMLLDDEHWATFLASHLELVYLCSEAHNRFTKQHFKAPPLIEDRTRLNDPPEVRDRPLAQALLVVRASTGDPHTIHINFDPG